MILIASAGAAAELPIRGQVVDENGAPLPDARVELWEKTGSYDDGVRQCCRASTEPHAVTRSDAAGFFHLPAPEGRWFRVVSSAPGRLAMQYEVGPLVESLELPPARLPRRHDLRARITASDGKPLSGVRVRTFPSRGLGSHKLSWIRAPRFGRTGDNGGVVLARDARNLRLIVFAPGFVEQVVSADEAELAVKLESGIARTVEVHDSEGRPIPGALVRVGPGRSAAGLTDALGRLVVHVPGQGRLPVLVEAPQGHLCWAGEIAPPSHDQVDPAVLVLRQGQTVSGQVSDASTGRPLAGAWVWLGGHVTRSDRDGTYSLPVRTEPPLGWRNIGLMQAVAKGYAPASATVSLPAASEEGARDVRRQDFALLPNFAVAGVVRDESGEPVLGAELTLVRQSGMFRSGSVARPAPRRFTRSRTGGRFRFTAVPNVVYDLSVSKPGRLTVNLEVTTDVEDAQPVEVILKRGRTGVGYVFDPGEQPIDGAEVSLLSTGRSAGHNREAVTDAEGRFVLPNLAPGKFDLLARAQGLAAKVVPGLVIGEDEDIASGDLDLGTLYLEPGVRFAGRVVDQDGRALEGADVHCYSGASARQWRRALASAAVTDADGRFVIEDRPREERVTLSASLAGYRRQSLPEIEVPPSEDVTLVLARLATVRGRVVDLDSSPVQNAAVSFQSESVPGSRTSSGGLKSDMEGRFERDVDPGRVILEANSGELRAKQVVIALEPGQVVGDVRLVLVPTPVVAGRVLGPSGDPLPGVRIQGIQDSMSFDSGPRVTDEEGRFRLTGLETGFLMLDLKPPAGLPGMIRYYEVKPGVNEIEIRFAGGHEVTGRVVDGKGRALLAAQVSLGRSHTETDFEGAFRFDNVPDGSYQLDVRKKGYVMTDARDVEIRGAPVHGLEVRLGRGSAVVGRILGIEPDRFAEVRARASNARGWNVSGRVDFAGNYRIESLQPGEWTVEARHPPSGLRARERLVLEPEAEALLDLELTSGLTLSGLVTVNGEPLSSVTPGVILPGVTLPGTRLSLSVQLRGLDVHIEEKTVTDYQGGFRFTGLSAGRYLVEVGGPPAFGYRREVELDADREVAIEISTGELGGRVVDARDGTPLGDTAVMLFMGERRFARPRATTDAQGRFHFQGVAEGRYRVRVVRQGYAVLQEEVEVRSGTPVPDLELELRRTPGLVLNVALADGGTPYQVTVGVLDAAGGVFLDGGPHFVEDGQVNLEYLPSGAWSVLVGVSGHGTVRVEVEVPSDPVSILLERGGRLDVTVTELAESEQLAVVTLTDGLGQPFVTFDRRGRLRREWPMSYGRTKVYGLPPGTWTVTATGSEHSWSAVTTLPAGAGTSHLVLESR